MVSHCSRLERLESRIAPATIMVLNYSDHDAGSLRVAIEKANMDPGSDTIVFKSKGVVKLLSALPTITDDLIVSGGKKASIDGANKVSLLSVSGAGLDVTLDGLKLTHGFGETGSALFIDAEGGTLKLKNSIVTGNVAAPTVDEYGDAVGATDVSGGAITNAAGTLEITSSKITKNQAKTAFDGASASGGAIFNAGTLKISGKTTISGNSATGAIAMGGAIFNDEGGSVKLDGVQLSKNAARGANGIAGVNGSKGANGARGAKGEDGEPGEDGVSGADGTDGGNGQAGAIFNLGTLTIERSKITGNAATGGNGGNGGNGGAGGSGGAGGGGYSYGGYHYPGGSRGYGGAGGYGGASGSGGVASGGAIQNGSDGVVTISGTTISKNSAKSGTAGKAGTGGKGGAVGGLSGENGAAGVDGASAAGGAIFNEGSVSMAEKTFVTRNSVAGGDASGGGIHNTGTLEVVNSTIAGNSAKGANGPNGAAGGKGANGANGEKGENGDRGQDGGDGGDGEDGSEGGAGAAGNPGGFAKGGGIFNSAEVTIQRSTISGNVTIAGNGGNGGSGGDGGKGGAGGAGGRGGKAYSYEGYHYPAGHKGAHGAAGYGANGGYGGEGGAAGAAQGGGIFNGDDIDATLVVRDSTISGNVVKGAQSGKGGNGGKAGAGRSGGAALGGERGLDAEPVPGEGGGIFSGDSSLTISQSTIAKNSASGNGGGIAVIENVFTSVHNSTIAANRAKAAGGGLYAELDPMGDVVLVISTIIAKNSAAGAKDVSGTISASFSLIQITDGTTLTGASNVTGVDPKLKALGTRGGPTQVMLLLRSSPALNAGSNPDALAKDQQGDDRVVGAGIDIGAVESQ